MANLVRCSNCFEVVPAGTDNCPSCGGPLKKLPSFQPETTPSFQEKYRDAQITPPVAPAAPPRHVMDRGSMSLVLIGLGIAMLIVVGGAGAYMIYAGPGPAPTQAPIAVAHTDPPTPPPTLPPVLQNTVTALMDPHFSAHVKIETSYASGHPENPPTIMLDAYLSDGNARGTLTYGTKTPFVIFSGVCYQQSAGRWTSPCSRPTLLKVTPFFSLRSAAELRLIGPEDLAGQPAFHLQNSAAWKADAMHIALLAVNPPYAPETETLDVWAAEDGTPMKATYVATTLKADGSTLLSIKTTYTFTDVGLAVQIDKPK